MIKIKKQTILIKISGESLKSKDSIISKTQIQDLCNQIKKIHKLYNIGIVLGGGNIVRGANTNNNLLSRTSADIMGMLATEINSLALRDALEANGLDVCLYSLIYMPTVARPYDIFAARKDIAKGNIVIFAGGTGNPYFTTDSGVALRALEIDASFILMGKNDADGIYDSDPNKNTKAKRFSKISYDQIIDNRLHAMDITAASLLSESSVKIIVFNAKQKDCFLKALQSNIPTTIISRKEGKR